MFGWVRAFRWGWQAARATIPASPLVGEKDDDIVDGKLDGMMLSHLDGIYVFSARKNCDALVSEIIRQLLESRETLAAMPQPAVQLSALSEDEAVEIMNSAAKAIYNECMGATNVKTMIRGAYRALIEAIKSRGGAL